MKDIRQKEEAIGRQIELLQARQFVENVCWESRHPIVLEKKGLKVAGHIKDAGWQSRQLVVVQAQHLQIRHAIKDVRRYGRDAFIAQTQHATVTVFGACTAV